MKGWLKLALLGAVAVAAAEVWLRARDAAEPPLENAAPAFTLPDLQGKPVSLQALRGRVVAVNFWATWCGPCREEIPELSRVYAANKDRCFEMLGIAEESGGRDDVADSARRFGINYPVLLDDGGRIGEAFKIPGYPRTYLIDHEGRVRRTFTGAVDRADLDAALEPLLAAAPRTCPRSL
jgi:cytochrome c biogenesis protein CcmG/thiol:disulfide interchange protein DsbE